MSARQLRWSCSKGFAGSGAVRGKTNSNQVKLVGQAIYHYHLVCMIIIQPQVMMWSQVCFNFLWMVHLMLVCQTLGEKRDMLSKTQILWSWSLSNPRWCRRYIYHRGLWPWRDCDMDSGSEDEIVESRVVHSVNRLPFTHGLCPKRESFQLYPCVERYNSKCQTSHLCILIFVILQTSSSLCGT